MSEIAGTGAEAKISNWHAMRRSQFLNLLREQKPSRLGASGPAQAYLDEVLIVRMTFGWKKVAFRFVEPAETWNAFLMMGMSSKFVHLVKGNWSRLGGL
ncbi:hypothetical protein DDE20_00055 [Pararhodobacter oceanensis]|uniref:Uncharacterized protein n=1 Tax=Pararhodobacter oceanensis TaxID=2172121 RepID=A0A2T8HX59_9RHOB|nr:hypothetical protein DDE20_00055 [Pararhodobacter oceanensis]